MGGAGLYFENSHHLHVGSSAFRSNQLFLLEVFTDFHNHYVNYVCLLMNIDNSGVAINDTCITHNALFSS
jgi:hypothetical protein